MCTYTTLSKGKNGYIVFCRRCSHYQIAFGTSLINMSEEEFTEFNNVAREQYAEQKNNGMEWYKNIQLPVFAQNNLMVLSYVELKLMIDMLNEARATREVNTMLQECKIISNENS